jgi:hypothetical protein
VVSPAQVAFQPWVFLGVLSTPCFSPRQFDSLFVPSISTFISWFDCNIYLVT